VYRPEHLSVTVGDTIRVTKNFKGFRNNALHKITGISEDSLELDGRAMPGSMYHIDQGIAVTSHAAQGKTVDQVIVSAPVEAFSQVNQEQFYVSMSRARQAMHLITDSKAALRAAVTRTSQRLSPREVINGLDQQKVITARDLEHELRVDLQAGARRTREQGRGMGR
jgi:hypothetical protein